MNELEALDLEIGRCVKCASYIKIDKNESLKRGSYSKIMVIGLSPGNIENRSGYAFSGQSGKKLFEWLIQAEIGKDELDIRSKIYFTSLVKCKVDEINLIKRIFHNCEPYLKRQVTLLKPTIILTLGVNVFNTLFQKKLESNDIIGSYFDYSFLNTSPLFPEFGTLYGAKYIIPLPHPSGLNRWLNTPANKQVLKQSLDILKKLYYE